MMDLDLRECSAAERVRSMKISAEPIGIPMAWASMMSSCLMEA